MNRPTFATFVFMTSLVLCSACERSPGNKRVVASVGDVSLSIDELVDEIPRHIHANLTSVEVREYVLRWINDQVLYQEALAQKLDEQKDLQGEFRKLKEELLINRLIEGRLNNDITVSDEETKAYYESNKEEFILSEDIVHGYHFLTNSKKEGNTVRNRIRAGENFADVVRQVRPDSLNEQEWDMGYFARSEIIPEIADVIFKLRKAGVSRLTKSKFGFHLVQVVDKQKKGEVKRFEIVKDEIRLKLEEKKKKDKYQRYLLQMKSKFKIRTNFQLLDSAILDSLLAKGV